MNPPALPWHREAVHPNFPDYVVRSDGNIFKNGAQLTARLNKVTGYMRVAMRDKSGCAGRRLVHRVVLEAFSRRPAQFDLACHRNDVKTDNRLDNLYWGGRIENARDAKANCRLAIGEAAASAVLNAAQVIAIRKARQSGETQAALSRRYGVSQGHISDICNGKKWSHIQHENVA